MTSPTLAELLHRAERNNQAAEVLAGAVDHLSIEARELIDSPEFTHGLVKRELARSRGERPESLKTTDTMRCVETEVKA